MEQVKDICRQLFSWQGDVGRGVYASTGFVLFFFKWNLDRILSGYFFSITWLPYQYLLPDIDLQDKKDLGLMLSLTALPFIYLGILLTVKRLRAIGAPTFLAGLFFVPFINLIFFMILSILPNRKIENTDELPPPNWVSRFVPLTIWKSFLFSAGTSVLPCLLLLIAAVQFLQNYGWGVFVGLPFVQGMFTVLLHSCHHRRSYIHCLLLALSACAMLAACVLLLAIEGIICLAMASCIALPICILGASVGYFIQATYHANRIPAVLLLTLFFLMGFEKVESPKPLSFAVTSTIEVNAPPQTVWQNVVSFSELPPVEDWLFKTGLAYPIRAKINGTGVGAIRHCEFSTGPFVEPITIWNEPTHLRFGVTSMPQPMQEWTFYKHIHPPHLDGYFKTTQGEFRLESIGNGQTRLHGTTWYQNDLSPAHYWKIWSDFLIHRIHLRVLKHVKHLSEKNGFDH